MKKYFIASHGKLASGFKSSLDILLGNTENVTVYDAYIDEKNFETILVDYLNLQSENDQIILMSDLYGGSVNQIMVTYAQKENIELIAGVNLAFVLEIIACSNFHLSKKEIDEMISNSRDALRRVVIDDLQEAEEFF
jgi:mannose/fructose-specific phosphotransferase system component IIA